MNCQVCGKKMKYQGGQWQCMNPSCKNYLVGIKEEKKEEKEPLTMRGIKAMTGKE